MTLRNLIPAALWLGFALGTLTTFWRLGSWSSLGMAVVNLTIAALFLFRRSQAPSASRRPEVLLAWTGTFLPFAFRPDPDPALMPIVLQLLGMTGIWLSLASLGRSFGVSPASRGLVTHGLYRWVRHPLYTTELLYFLGIVAAAPHAWNLALWATLATIQALRARNEERCLSEDQAYREYRLGVPYRFLPRVI